MDPASSTVFMKAKPKGIDTLNPGEYFLKDKGKPEKKLYAPLMTLDDMAKLAASAKPIDYTGGSVQPDTKKLALVKELFPKRKQVSNNHLNNF